MDGREREAPKLLLNQGLSEPCYATGSHGSVLSLDVGLSVSTEVESGSLPGQRFRPDRVGSGQAWDPTKCLATEHSICVSERSTTAVGLDRRLSFNSGVD